jgi:hypothetical protein
MNARRLGGLAVLLLASACARRVPSQPPQEDPLYSCSTHSVRFEQTGGACAPFPQYKLAYELVGERCDEVTLAQARQRLQQEPGLEHVEVVRGERVPGTSLHPVFVQYASPEAGTCPSDRKYPRGYCEDCPVQRVFFMTTRGLGCGAPGFAKSVIRDVQAQVPTCKAEHLDAARAELWRRGWFSDVQVNCVTNDEGLTQLVVDADVSEPEQVCEAFKGPVLKPRCPAVTSNCASNLSCHTNPDGCQVCTCESQLSRFVRFLLEVPAAFLAH